MLTHISVDLIQAYVLFCPHIPGTIVTVKKKVIVLSNASLL